MDSDSARKRLVDGRAREMSASANDAGGGRDFFSSSFEFCFSVLFSFFLDFFPFFVFFVC